MNITTNSAHSTYIQKGAPYAIHLLLANNNKKKKKTQDKEEQLGTDAYLLYKSCYYLNLSLLYRASPMSSAAHAVWSLAL